MAYFMGSVAAAATADDIPPDRIEVTLFGGYRSGGALEETTGKTTAGDPIKVDASLEKSVSFGVALNWEAEPDSFYELAYSRQSTTLSAAKPFDVTVEYLQIGGYTTTAKSGAKVIPYFLLTVGMGRLVPDDDELKATTKAAAAVGGGAKVYFTQHIAMRFDARLYAMFLGNDKNIFCGGSGSATCKIQLAGDSLIQPDISLGFTYGF
jgi:hypothetical protein